MPARTVGPEPGLDFGTPQGVPYSQFGIIQRAVRSTFTFGAPTPNLIKCTNTWLIGERPNSESFTLFPYAKVLQYPIMVTHAGVSQKAVLGFGGAGDYGANIADPDYQAYVWGTGGYVQSILIPVGPNEKNGLPTDSTHPIYISGDHFDRPIDRSFYGVLVNGRFTSSGVTWNSGYAQNAADWYAAWRAWFLAAKTLCPQARYSPHLGGMADWSQFQSVFEDCPALEFEWFKLSTGPSFRRSDTYNMLVQAAWFANDAPPVFPSDPPTRIVQWGTALDNGDIHTAFAIYAMMRGPNTFFGLLDGQAHFAINPSAWLPTSNWIGAATSSPTPVVGAGGSSLLMRTFAGGIAYYNLTGSPQTVTLPAGFTNWNGGSVSTATIGDGKGDVFLAPTTGALPGSGGGGGGPGGGGPPPPPPPPVATATNTCCITIGAVPEIPDTPGTPNLYLAFIGSADVTGTALTLSADLMLFVNGVVSNLVGFDSPDFAFLDSPIMIYGAGLGGIPFWTTIAAITDARNVTLADAVPVNVIAQEVDCYFPIIQLPNAETFKYYVRIGTYDMHSSLSTRPTLNFEIFSYPVHGSGLTFLPNAGQPALLIIEGQGDAFGGSIDQVQSENVPGKLPVTNKCQCVSWDQVLTKRLLMLTGAFPTGTNRDTFTGDGTKAIFVLSAPPVGIVSVTLNGVPQTFAINSTLAYLSWNVDSTTVTIFGTPPAAGAILVVTYQAAGVTIAPPGYLNQTADQIFFALIQTIALAEGLAALAVPGPLVDQIQFTSQDTVDSALQSLMAYISDGLTDYWYWVSPRKVVHFEVQGVTQSAPWGIDVSDLSDANVLMQVGLTTTREKFANACWADIGAAKGLSTLTQTFAGDGNTRTFQTQFPISSVVSLTKIIASTATGTITNVPQEAIITGQAPLNPGDAWYYNLNQNSLTEDPANPTLPASTNGNVFLLQIVYTPAAAITEQFENTASFAARHLIEGGSGETDLYVNLGNTNAVLANASVAQNEATYFAQMTKKLDVVTYRPGLQSGQGITVNLPNIGAVGLFIVDTIQLIDENGRWKWSVQCSAGAIVGDWKKAMVQLANLL